MSESSVSAARAGACARRLGIVAPLFAAAACAGADHVDLDRLARASGARTVVVEDDFTLFSHYDSSSTVRFVEVVQEEYDATARLFERSVDEELLVHMVPMPGSRIFEENGKEMLEINLETTNGIWGFTDSRRTILVYLYPDLERPNGTTIQAVQDEGRYRGVLRHELTHVILERLVDDPPLWLNEGMAHLIERMELQLGDLQFPEQMQFGLHLPVPPLEELLAWTERPARIHSGEEEGRPEMRSMARAFVAFLLARQGAIPFPHAVQKVASMSRPDLLGLEEEWRDWLQTAWY